MKNIYVRAFHADEWSLLKAKRLEALRKCSKVFTGRYEVEANQDDQYWKNTVTRGADGRVFGLFDGDELIGITGVFRNKNDSSGASVMLCMSYIDENYRGLGLSRLLYQARLAWARENGYQRACVSHREDNIASQRANAAFGFVRTNSEAREFGDGTVATDYSYELRL